MQIIVIVICIVVILAMCIGLVFFLLHHRNSNRKELNRKIAIFEGRLVNKNAEGTMGYGLLFGETVADGGTCVTGYAVNNSNFDIQKKACIVLHNLQTGQTIKKNMIGSLVIGRDVQRDCDTYLAVNNPDISRQHCQLYFSNGVLYIRDLGSKNYTYLNGQKLSKEALIQSGDMIGLGNARFKISIMH